MPEDFLPFFQIPAGKPGEATVIVPVPRAPAAPGRGARAPRPPVPRPVALEDPGTAQEACAWLGERMVVVHGEGVQVVTVLEA